MKRFISALLYLGLWVLIASLWTINDWFIAEAVRAEVQEKRNELLYGSTDAVLPWATLSEESKAPHSDLKESLQEWFDELFDFIDAGYYYTDKIDYEAMVQNARKWFIDALEDPYTVYLTPEENQVFTESMEWSQNFEWIGAVVTKKDNGVLIENVLKWSPAAAAGLMPLDIVLAVDEEPVDVLGLNEAVELIRWPEWTTVTLTVLRADETTIDEVDVVRAPINVPSVEFEQITTDSWSRILYASIAIFWDDTVEIFEEYISQPWVANDIEGVVLDLRWNWWGYLPWAVDIASHFLPRNELVTVAKYSVYPDEEFRANGAATFLDVPVVVLVDGLSASASEIVAGALQQRSNAQLVWSQTFGKWSIQTIQENPDDSSLKFTIWARYLPDGSSVNEEWLTPDTELEIDFDLFEAEERDNQREEAIRQVDQRIQWATE